MIQGFNPLVRSKNLSSEIMSAALTEWSICFLTVITSRGFELLAEIIAERMELIVTQLYSFSSNFPFHLKYCKNISWHVKETVIDVT